MLGDKNLYLSRLRMTSQVDMYTALYGRVLSNLKSPSSGRLDFTDQDTEHLFQSKIKHANKMEVLY